MKKLIILLVEDSPLAMFPLMRSKKNYAIIQGKCPCRKKIRVLLSSQMSMIERHLITRK